jgi:adenylate cyclase
LSDIFISYARPTASEARVVAAALRALGHSVWVDDELPAHRAYAEVIEERLAAARVVIVVW